MLGIAFAILIGFICGFLVAEIAHRCFKVDLPFFL